MAHSSTKTVKKLKILKYKTFTLKIIEAYKIFIYRLRKKEISFEDESWIF